jgi:O-methyltransferase
MIIKLGKKAVKSLFKTAGYNISKIPAQKINEHYLGYSLEQEANIFIEMIRYNTMVTYERLVSLYQQVVHCEINDIPGDFIECGVWKGGAVGLMALTNLKYGKERRQIHLFDAFDDICEPDLIDGESAMTKAIERGKAAMGESYVPSGRLVPVKGFFDSQGGYGTLEDNINLLEKRIGYDPNFLNYHQGWFQDTLPKDAKNIDKIAILRLDGDWYASTKICLENLFDKVVSGGFIIIDDYACYDGCKIAVDEFLQKNNHKLFLNHVDAECRYIIKA